MRYNTTQVCSGLALGSSQNGAVCYSHFPFLPISCALSTFLCSTRFLPRSRTAVLPYPPVYYCALLIAIFTEIFSTVFALILPEFSMQLCSSISNLSGLDIDLIHNTLLEVLSLLHYTPVIIECDSLSLINQVSSSHF